ncbi:fimbrial biogenesis chaperone [Sphingomonas xanthus]|uniref:Fimbria/pilus periplasmic chaperone n=1 Tax=Sphingomonas xanthus TaxID=2594473 RepID=A0A516IU42_9SPHN|nr:fimbria/pilus periplasmic chaperone [Sphingomonas xanthus]QDP20417.1 fimbria/pilus periplasmic chaperone [Sphingomonas xanthus]
MSYRFLSLATAAVSVAAFPQIAAAEIVLSQLVLDIPATRPARQDIEIWNSGSERTYVSVTPAEMIEPGTAKERRLEQPDPEKLGLLVSPGRLILEPGQHKIIRVTPLDDASDRERVYRLTIRPEVGEVTGDQTGLKILVGYDVLALVRPDQPVHRLTGTWAGSQLKIRNDGNTSVELIGGRSCTAPNQCTDVPGKRLYAGAEWNVPVTTKAAVEFRYMANGKTQTVRF